ncbi:MAG: hypothetical protein QXF26_05220 [Candidatus Bathyarchaeia archaeon]
MSRLKKFGEILKKALNNVPSLDLDEERENQLIEKIAQAISKRDLETPAILFGVGYIPMSTFLSYTGLLPLAPFLEAIGINGYEYTALFSKKRNVRRLLGRIEELKNAKEQRTAETPS